MQKKLSFTLAAFSFLFFIALSTSAHGAKAQPVKLNPTDETSSLSSAELSDGGWNKVIFSDDDGELSPVDLEHVPSIVRQLMREGDRVIKAIKTLGGLHAWVVQLKDNPTQSVSYFTTPDDLFILSGSILYESADKELKSLSEIINDKYQPIKDLAMQWERLADSHYIAEGAKKDKTIIYGFIDPNCNYCYLSWLAFKPYVDIEEVQMRWIPVAAISQDSVLKTAYLLQSENPRAELVRAYLRWEDGKPGASFEAADELSDELVEKIELNNQLLREFAATGAPIFIYKDENEIVNMVSGAMRIDQIVEVLGADSFAHNDPRLDPLK